MAANKKIDMNAPNLLTVNAEAVEAALQNGIRAALLKNKQANNPVAVWRNGKVVLVDASEFLPESNKVEK